MLSRCLLIALSEIINFVSVVLVFSIQLLISLASDLAPSAAASNGWNLMLCYAMNSGGILVYSSGMYYPMSDIDVVCSVYVPIVVPTRSHSKRDTIQSLPYVIISVELAKLVLGERNRLL